MLLILWKKKTKQKPQANVPFLDLQFSRSLNEYSKVALKI